MYECETEGVLVRVQPDYLEEESEPDEGRFLWAYTVEIENRGAAAIQLINRSWRITDAMGRTEQVSGEGVVGEQPVIGPGERYRYTSGAPLPTPSGFMAGSYGMQREDGVSFRAEIPQFSLDRPDDAVRLH